MENILDSRPKLPRSPHFVHVNDPDWERWNYVVPGYAVVGRVTHATKGGHEGEFWFVTGALWHEHSGWCKTLPEAQREVAAYIAKHFQIEKPSQPYNGA